MKKTIKKEENNKNNEKTLIENDKNEFYNQQIIFENKISLLLKYLKQQIQINKVLIKVENTSNQIDDTYL